MGKGLPFLSIECLGPLITFATLGLGWNARARTGSCLWQMSEERWKSSASTVMDKSSLDSLLTVLNLTPMKVDRW